VMLTRRRALNPVTIVALLLALVAAGRAVMVWPTDKEPTMYSYFTDASPLDVGSEVRASGVKVGSVASIELDGDVAKVGLDLDEAVLPLHEDATLTIRPINLLGENFVDLDAGTASAPELEGDIPVSQTSKNVTLQSLLDTFDDPTSAGLAALITELGKGVEGRGGELAAAIDQLGPVMQQIDSLGDVLRSQNETLNSLVETADPIAQAVSGPEGRRLDRMIQQATETLHSLSVQKQGIRNTIAELPATLREARTTLAALDTVADATTPTLRRARPVTRDLKDIAGEISDFTVEATPAFSSFDGVFAEADKLLAQAGPAVRALRRSGPGIVRVTKSARPAADQLLRDHLGDLMAFVRKWALSTNGRDAVSHYFRGVVHVTPEAMNSLLGSDAIPPVIDAAPGDGNSDPNQVLPDLPNLNLDDVVPNLDHLLDGILGNVGLGGHKETRQRETHEDESVSGATGLTSDQEQALLSQILGGNR
jgi:phospholipid/cholesterol/gamma-HCH transport system substrate-binding protein